jgi:hypothetical protein
MQTSCPMYYVKGRGVGTGGAQGARAPQFFSKDQKCPFCDEKCPFLYKLMSL